MTTIAYKDGILAADTQLTISGEVSHGATKLHEFGGFLFGFCGEMSLMIPVVDALRRVERKAYFGGADNICSAFARAHPEALIAHWEDEGLTDIGEDWTGLLIGSDRSVWLTSCGRCPIRMPRGFEAIGSGAEYALGAMELDASAQTAVKVAARFDAHTNAEVRTLNVSILQQ